MILKSVKAIVVVAVGALVVGGVLFGTDLGSYVRSSVKSMRSAANDAVPVEFQLKRARDLLDEIVPEMQANIRLIAEQEVEVERLKGDIAQNGKSLTEEHARIGKLRDSLQTAQVSYPMNGINYSRQQVKDELARRFDRYKEAEVVLAGKKRLLENREKSLAAAMQLVERTRSQKASLENQIEGLEAQFRLVQASSVGSGLAIDTSKMAQTEKLIGQVKKQLDVAERVLAHQARFTEPMQVDVIDEAQLMSQIDEHFGNPQQEVATGGK